MARLINGDRLLLIHPGALGDLIQAFPAFGSIRQTFGGAHITLVVGDTFASFARQTELFDSVISFDADIAYHGNALQRLSLLVKIAADLRRCAPSRVGVFKGAPIYALLALASRASVRVGLARGFGKRLLTEAIAIDPNAHREDRYMAVAERLGVDETITADVQWRLLTDAMDLGVGPWIGIAPGGARNVKEEMPVRRWSPDRYAGLAAKLLERMPQAKIVLLGSAGDRDEADTIKRALPAHSTVDLVGQTTLSEARAVVAQMSIFIGHDSGLLHVAATTGTPIAAIFGPTDPRVACPRGRQIRTLWNPVLPAPCYDEVTGKLRDCSASCCIDRVTADDVFHVVVEQCSRFATV